MPPPEEPPDELLPPEELLPPDEPQLPLELDPLELEPQLPLLDEPDDELPPLLWCQRQPADAWFASPTTATAATAATATTRNRFQDLTITTS